MGHFVFVLSIPVQIESFVTTMSAQSFKAEAIETLEEKSSRILDTLGSCINLVTFQRRHANQQVVQVPIIAPNWQRQCYPRLRQLPTGLDRTLRKPETSLKVNALERTMRSGRTNPRVREDANNYQESR